MSPCCPIGGAAPAIVVTESNSAGVKSICQCPAGEAWNPNSGTCGPPAGQCTATGCVGAGGANWQYSITCRGMDVGIIYDGGCTDLDGNFKKCYAGFNQSTVSASWSGAAGPPTWDTAEQQGSPTVCTSGFGQHTCNMFTISGLPECPIGPTPPPPLCPFGGERDREVLRRLCACQKSYAWYSQHILEHSADLQFESLSDCRPDAISVKGGTPWKPGVDARRGSWPRLFLLVRLRCGGAGVRAVTSRVARTDHSRC